MANKTTKQEPEKLTITAEHANFVRNNCKALSKVCQCMENLFNNEDFLTIFKFYTEDEPVRITTLLSIPEATVSEKKDIFVSDLHEQLNAISRFRYFCINKIPFIREQIKKQLEDLDNAEIK